MIALLLAGAIALVFTLLLTPLFIRLFTGSAGASSSATTGRRSHHAKRGTPTMGGIVFIFGAVLGYFVGHWISSEPADRSPACSCSS